MSVSIDHDDDPTPADHDTLDSGIRRRSLPIMRRTNPHGIPAVTVSEDSDGKLAVVEAATLEVRIDRIERDLAGSRRAAGKLKGWIVAAVIAAGGSLGAVLVKMLDTREADGGRQVHMQYLEQRVHDLEIYLFPWRRADVPTGASWLPMQPSMSPAPPPGVRP